jgi:hypothetical protein
MTKKRLLIFATLLSGQILTNCGPSSKEIEEKRIADSTLVSDSLTKTGGIYNVLNLSTRTPGDKQFIKTGETKFLVRNVRAASEKIEDLAVKYSGYVTYSKLRNDEQDYSRMEISRDSVLIAKNIVVENHIVLKIPNENLDSLVRELNKMILFLDYRIIKMDDISFALLANQRASKRLSDYDLRQKKHIDTKQSKLKETTTAEETILQRQIQSDNLQVENMALEDQVKYCTLTILIYQKPVLYHDVQVQLNTDSFRENLFKRILDALVEGWIMFEYLIVFMFRVWWLFAMAIVGIVIYKYPFKRKID